MRAVISRTVARTLGCKSDARDLHARSIRRCAGRTREAGFHVGHLRRKWPTMSPRLLSGRLAATRSSVLLLGARQVGKSTICRGLGARLYVDLADESVFLGYAKDPARLRREVDALPGGSLVVIDEVQRVPALLNTVQSLVDRSARRIRFVLTGSSARKLRRGGANLLPGRVILEYLDPLSVLETPHQPAGLHSRPARYTPRERRIARSTACWSGRAIAPSLRRIMVRLIVR